MIFFVNGDGMKVVSSYVTTRKSWKRPSNVLFEIMPPLLCLLSLDWVVEEVERFSQTSLSKISISSTIYI